MGFSFLSFPYPYESAHLKKAKRFFSSLCGRGWMHMSMIQEKYEQIKDWAQIAARIFP